MSLTQQVLAEHVDKLREYRFIVVQHLMSDTYSFLTELLESGVEVDRLFVKEYSCDTAYYDALQGVVARQMIGGDMTPHYTAALREAIEKSKRDGKRVAVLDLGGEFAPIVAAADGNGVPIVVVEDTAFGHRKYADITLNDPNIQLFSVAQSDFKEIEAIFVGEAVVSSTERVLRSLGKTLCGVNALLIGYGMIGKNVAAALRKRGCIVSVYDKQATRTCRAHFDGYRVGGLHELLADNAVVIGATGETSLNDDDIAYLRDGAVLVSASSKQVEFCERLLAGTDSVSEHVDLCRFADKAVYLLNGGYPINFIDRSVPDYIIEFMFAEMLMCLAQADATHRDGIREVSAQGRDFVSQRFLATK
ncbi:MAG: hypothetical protein IJB26_01220 [Clostridia bacterium]|nr:hypothetical protein [Clostridia bacterium]